MKIEKESKVVNKFFEKNIYVANFMSQLGDIPKMYQFRITQFINKCENVSSLFAFRQKLISEFRKYPLTLRRDFISIDRSVRYSLFYYNNIRV